MHAVLARNIFPNKIKKHPMLRPLLEVEIPKKYTPLLREADFKLKYIEYHRIPHVQTTFGSWDAEKAHAVVTRSRFPNQNKQNTPCSDHFWKLRCRKSTRKYCAKQISKSKCIEYAMLRPLLEVEMPKKRTPLLREAHFQVKIFNIPPGSALWKLRYRNKIKK